MPSYVASNHITSWAGVQYILSRRPQTRAASLPNHENPIEKTNRDFFIYRFGEFIFRPWIFWVHEHCPPINILPPTNILHS